MAESMRVPARIVVAVAISALLAGCYESHRQPRAIRASDGGAPTADERTPSRCFPEGADTFVLTEVGDCASATFGPAGSEDWFPANGDPFRIFRGADDVRVEMTVEPRCAGRTDAFELTLWNLNETCENGEHLRGGACGFGDEAIPYSADSALDDAWSEHILWSDLPVRITVCAVAP